MSAALQPPPLQVGSDPLELLKARAGEVATLLRQLAHPTRLLLLCQISQGERAVSQLESETGLRQPALSQQLAELREAGLVRTRRVSRQVFYAIADARALTLLHSLHALYCGDPAALPAPALVAPIGVATSASAAIGPVVMSSPTEPASVNRKTDLRADVARFARIE